jgi:hypothetical protein
MPNYHGNSFYQDVRHDASEKTHHALNSPACSSVSITLSLSCGEQRRQNAACVKRYWETIADNLSKAGWSWGCVSTIDANGHTIWITDAHRDGKRFIVRADEILTPFLEAERAILRRVNCERGLVHTKH